MINSTWDVFEWLFIYFFWVETKGKTLEEIDGLFEEKDGDVVLIRDVLDGKSVDVVEELDGVSRKDNAFTSVKPSLDV